MIKQSSLNLLTSQGKCLAWVSLHPDCSLADIAEGMYVEGRTAYSLIGALNRHGLIQIRKDGRKHYYRIRGYELEGALRKLSEV